MSKCVDICRAVEATSPLLKEMAPSQHSSEVDLVSIAEPKKPNSRKEKKKSPKISSSRNASFVAVSMSVIEQTVLHMVTSVLLAKNLITSL